MFGRNPRYAWIPALFMAVVTLVLGLLQLRQVEHLQTRAVPMAAVVQSTTGVDAGSIVVRELAAPQRVCTAGYQKRPPPAVGEVVTVLYDLDNPDHCPWRSMPPDSEWGFPLAVSAFFWLGTAIGIAVALALRRRDPRRPTTTPAAPVTPR
jgi:hypothetical protein